MKHLIGKGAAVNAKDDASNTPLHYAAERGHAMCCRVLCEGGADMNAVNKDGQRPSEIAKDNETKESMMVTSSKCCLIL